MPELPEVETVKNSLIPVLINKTINGTSLLYPRIIKSAGTGLEDLVGKSFLGIERIGKFLHFKLSDNYDLLLHLRMEGKCFYEEELAKDPPKSLSFILHLNEGNLAFYDTRKFAVLYIFKDEKDIREIEPLIHVGKDPFQIDGKELFQRYSSDNRYLKSCLLDQSIMSGIGNIYADETLFAAKLSPFKKASTLLRTECDLLLKEARRILALSIEKGGSTVKSYKSSADHSGQFQQELRVYSHEGKLCPICKTKIEKRYLDGRGTTFCRHCQGHGIVVGITGLIGSGKSTVTKLFVKEGFKLYDCDKRVHQLYKDPGFIKKLQSLFPVPFKNGFNREILLGKLLSDTKFRREFETYLYRIIRNDVIEYLNENFEENIVIEAPRLFEARIEKLCSFVIGVVADDHLIYDRLTRRLAKDIPGLLKLNQKSLFLKRIKNLDYIIDNSSSEEELETKTLSIIKDIRKENN